MLENLLDPVVLCFVAGVAAGLSRTDLKFPEALYETLSIYLLFAIGFKGGIQLSESEWTRVIGPAAGTLGAGLVIPLISYWILRALGAMKPHDAAAIAAHYGSVSAVTFAVVLSYLNRLGVPAEEFVTVLLVILEVPAIMVGILLARLSDNSGPVRWKPLLHEVFFGKSVYLLLSGLLIGWLAGAERAAPVKPLFFDLFKGALMLFLLEMGTVASRRIRDLAKTGWFLTAFGIGMPVLSGAIGTAAGYLTGLSPGGTAVLATLCASASYIAAPAAMRIAVPKANPTLYLTASLGITFPFNLVAGIPLYHWMAQRVHEWGGKI